MHFKVVIQNLGTHEKPNWVCFNTTSPEQIQEAIDSGGRVLSDEESKKLFGQYINRVSDDNTVVSEDGKNIISFTPPSEKMLAKEAAQVAYRNREMLLHETDFYFYSDYPLSDKKRKALVEYRQALRDITKQSGWPRDIQWPEKPKI